MFRIALDIGTSMVPYSTVLYCEARTMGSNGPSMRRGRQNSVKTQFGDWKMGESNPRPSVCETDVLPLYKFPSAETGNFLMHIKHTGK